MCDVELESCWGCWPKPGFEFSVFVEEEFESSGNHVRGRGIDELSIFVDPEFHVFLDPDLNGCC